MKHNINENEKILPRAAVIQDMSGFVRVSLTEAIPILAAMGVEVCPLPTAILSTHTYEFTDYTLLDMTDEMPKIIEHWNKLGLEFDAVYSGYLSSGRQIDIIHDFMQSQKKNGALCVVDPVLGDNALTDVKTVYSDRMTELIDGMRRLCGIADVITPNLTEACLLLDRDYPRCTLSNAEIKDVLSALVHLGAKSAVITSIMDGEDSMCVAVYDGGEYYKIGCDYVKRPFHGTGEGKALVDKIEEGENQISRATDKIVIRQLIADLDERDGEIVKMRYFCHKTQEQVAQKLGISQVQVSRLEKKILAKSSVEQRKMENWLVWTLQRFLF